MATGRKNFPEAKILVIGSRHAGKTSLIKKLKGGVLNPNEPETERIKIIPWYVKSRDSEFHFNIWDLGRDEVEYNTYRFFLTKHTLCIFVINANHTEQESRIEQTLRDIRKFGSVPPVIIVINKFHEPQQDVAKETLKRKFASSVSNIVEVSYMDAIGIDELKEMIIKVYKDNRLYYGKITDNWIAIKTRIENSAKNYILKNDYEEICQTKRLYDSKDRDSLLNCLHHLGVLSNFKDICILKPNWITSSVHKICNNNLMFHNKGILDKQIMANKIFPGDKAYPKDTHRYIMDIMRDFELCFDIDNEQDNRKVLISALLRKDEPFTDGWHPRLAFQYQYNVLPGSLMPRFIAKSLAHNRPKMYWQNGIVFEKDKNAALVKTLPEQNKIYVQFNNSEARHEFQPVIQSHLQHVHQSVQELGAIGTLVLENLAEDHTANDEHQKEVELFTQFKKKKESLDLKSEKKIKKQGLKLIISLVIIWINLGLAILIYGWDKIEPLTSMVGVGSIFFSCAYLFNTTQEFSPKAIYGKLVESEKKQTYKEYGFNLAEYERLEKRQASKSASHLNL